jgi:hypothetical protein
MPWCDDCAKFWNPNTLPAEGTCPSCGRVIATPRGEGDDDVKAPWHFKLLVFLAVVYIGWRLLQLVGLLN